MGLFFNARCEWSYVPNFTGTGDIDAHQAHVSVYEMAPPMYVVRKRGARSWGMPVRAILSPDQRFCQVIPIQHWPGVQFRQNSGMHAQANRWPNHPNRVQTRLTNLAYLCPMYRQAGRRPEGSHRSVGHVQF